MLKNRLQQCMYVFKTVQRVQSFVTILTGCKKNTVLPKNHIIENKKIAILCYVFLKSTPVCLKRPQLLHT